MGLSSAAAGDGAQLCVFDLRRGHQEGQELDKILFFHPADCPILPQLSVIGLCEGIITFTRIFSPEDDCEVIESEKHSHIFYQAESDIWMVLVVEKTKDSESTWRCGALQGILKEVHSLFTMFHGPIRTLLDSQPSAELARGHLHTFVTDYLSDFIVGKRLQLPTFRDSLKERGTVQMLTVSREVALEVQSLTTVLGSCLGNATCQSLVLFEDLLVSTTLSPDDTLNLYTYAVLRLTPRALSSNSNSWSYLRKGTYVNAGPTSSSSNGTASSERYHSRSRDTSPGGQNQLHHNFRPLQREKLSKGKDGFIAADFATTEVCGAVPLTPILWFQQAEERMYLCVYQHKNLTILLLVPASSLINGEEGIAHVKRHLLENASQNIVIVEQKLSRGWGGENAYHVSGYRYLIVDPDRKVSRASPPGKVTTLSKVVEKTKDSESTWRCGALQGILKEVHSLFTMFHGPIRTLLDSQPSAELARGHLHTFVTDYLSDFIVGKRLQLPTFRDSLKERGTVQMLTVSREVALEVQSLTTVLGSCLGNATCQSLVLFEDLLVSTTLSPDDTLNLYTYAVLRLTPRALSSNSNSWSYLRKGTYVNAGPTSSSSNGTASSERYHSRSRDTSPGGQNQLHHNFRPLQREKLSKGKDGFIAADFATTEVCGAVPLTPILWFQQAEERMYLCVYQHKNLTILLLVPASSLINGEEGIAHVKRHLLENASQNIVIVEQKLSRGWGGENAYHVSGYRYLIVDPDRKVSRASPPGKVTTLSKDSLLSLNRLREEIDLEKSRAKRSDPCHDKDFEVCIRAKNNAWVIAKITRGRELYMALEKGGETLLYASTAVEKFSNRYCDGAFSTD